MNLDDLKIQLNKKIEGVPPVGHRELADLLRHSSQSMVSKLKYSLVLEITVSVVFTLGCFFVGFYARQWALRIYSGIFGLAGLGFGLVLFYLIRRINKVSGAPLPVRENLKAVVKIMEDYERRYLQFSLALVPVSIFLAFWLSYQERPDFTLHWMDKNAVLLILVFGVTCVGIYFFNKWYLDRLYGRYITKLKESLADLAE